MCESSGGSGAQFWSAVALFLSFTILTYFLPVGIAPFFSGSFRLHFFTSQVLSSNVSCVKHHLKYFLLLIHNISEQINMFFTLLNLFGSDSY